MGIFSKRPDAPAGTVIEQRYLSDLALAEAAAAESLSLGKRFYTTQLPALYRARQMTVDTVAQLPYAAWTGSHRTQDQPSKIGHPNRFQTRRDFASDIMSALVDHGNAFLLDNVIAEGDIRVATNADVTVAWNRTQTGRLYSWRGKRLQHRRKSEDERAPRIIHIALDLGPENLLGVGPMESARLAGIVAANNYSANYFKNANIPSGILSHPGVLGADDAKRLEAQFNGRNDGRRMIAVVSGGMTFKALPVTPSDAAWSEAYNAGLLDIANIMGVDPDMIGYSGSAGGGTITYANVSQRHDAWVRKTLQPTYFSRIESALWLLVPRGQYVKINPDVLTRSARKDRYEAHKIGLDAGWLTIDEVRTMEGLEPLTADTAPAAPAPEDDA